MLLRRDILNFWEIVLELNKLFKGIVVLMLIYT